MKDLSSRVIQMYPTASQKRNLDFQIKVVGTIFNHFLSENMFLYEDGKDFMTFNEILDSFEEMKYAKEYEWMRLENADMNAIKRELFVLAEWLSKNNESSKRKKPKFPLFRTNDQAYTMYTTDSFDYGAGYITLNNVKNQIPVKSKDTISEPITSVTILRKQDGKFITVLNEITE